MFEQTICRLRVIAEVEFARMNRVVANDPQDVERLLHLHGQVLLFDKPSDLGIQIPGTGTQVVYELLH
jgi:hypothetical protein